MARPPATPQQGGSSTPSPQQGQSAPAPQQQGQPPRPIIQDWASI